MTIPQPSTEDTTMSNQFNEARVDAYRLLGDAQDQLRGVQGPTRRQTNALRAAERHITRAKEALNRAAQGGARS